MKKVAIFGGGTINDVAPHFSICSRAFGSTAKQINAILDGWESEVHFWRRHFDSEAAEWADE